MNKKIIFGFFVTIFLFSHIKSAWAAPVPIPASNTSCPSGWESVFYTSNENVPNGDWDGETQYEQMGGGTLSVTRVADATEGTYSYKYTITCLNSNCYGGTGPVGWLFKTLPSNYSNGLIMFDVKLNPDTYYSQSFMLIPNVLYSKRTDPGGVLDVGMSSYPAWISGWQTYAAQWSFSGGQKVVYWYRGGESLGTIDESYDPPADPLEIRFGLDYYCTGSGCPAYTGPISVLFDNINVCVPSAVTPTPEPTPTLTPAPTSSPTPTPTPTPISSKVNLVSSSIVNNASAPICTEKSPESKPKLFQITTFKNSAKLYYVPAKDPVGYYYVAYGLKENEPIYGVSFKQGASNGILSYTLNQLQSNTKYYFKIRGGNGCAPGEWSNTLMAKTTNSTKGSANYYSTFQTYITNMENLPSGLVKGVNLVKTPEASRQSNTLFNIFLGLLKKIF